MSTLRPNGIADTISIDDTQVAELEAIEARVYRGEAGYPDAYALIHGWI
jgi:hypothetical protein